MSAGAGSGTYDWTGFYAGLNAGGTLNDSKYTLKPTGTFLAPADALHDPANNPLRTDSGGLDSGAFTGGGQIGYNYQLGRFVFGIETDFDYNGPDESQYVNRPLAFPLNGSFIHTATQYIDYFGTLRGRLGFTPADQFMIFGTAGLAYADVSSQSNVLFTSGTDHYLGSSSQVQTGWAAGVGGEYALNKSLTVKVEYLYMNLGSKSYTYGQQIPAFAGYTYTTELDTAQNVIRVGINYRFH
jgi:outer membrane immunogenic protein